MSQEDGAEAESKPAVSWSGFVQGIVDDCLSTIVHEITLDAHRTEKILRMQSAATQISMLATEQKLVSPAVETPTKPTGSAGDLGGAGKRVETEGAVWDGGVITLKGNPLVTTKQIVCPQCRLPRLLYPLSGAGARVPDDLNIEYCTKHPYVQRAGHDIFGQPFPSMVVSKGKKEKDLLKQQRADKDSTPASQNSGAGADGREEDVQSSIAKLAPQGKGSDYIPWHTCPKCKRSLLITRFAQHLEKCMGISGRTASRNAMAKMGGQNSSIGSTPMGSRPGTPGPAASQGDAASGGRKRDRDDDDGDDADDAPLKKMKKRPYIKKADRERLVAESQGGGPADDTPSSQNGDKEGKDKTTERENIKLKIKPPGGGETPSKERDGLQARKPPKPGGDGGDDTPSRKLKKVVSNSSNSS